MRYIVHHDGESDPETTNEIDAMVSVLTYSYDGHPARLETLPE